jgi:integrase
MPGKSAMATFVKTPSGTWKAMVRLQGWPPAIKTFRLKDDARKWATNTEDDMIRGVYIKQTSRTRFTVADAIDRYLREVTPTKKESTQGPEIRRAAIMRTAFGKYSMATLTPDAVIKHRDERLAGTGREGPDGNPIPRANDTVRLELAFLGSVFEVAKDKWKIGLAYNPVNSVTRPKSKRRVRRVSAEEEKNLFAALDAYSNPMLGWLVRIAIETAMREAEILKLEIKQLDLKKRTITLPDTKPGEARTVPLNRKATEVFRKAIGNPGRPSTTDLIFPGEPGRDGKIRPYQFQSCWRILKLRAGVVDYRFHDNRHEAISRLVEANFSDQAIAAITGHKDLNTLARYRHLRSQKLVKMLDKADSVTKKAGELGRKSGGRRRNLLYTRRPRQGSPHRKSMERANKAQ